MAVNSRRRVLQKKGNTKRHHRRSIGILAPIVFTYFHRVFWAGSSRITQISRRIQLIIFREKRLRQRRMVRFTKTRTRKPEKKYFTPVRFVRDRGSIIFAFVRRWVNRGTHRIGHAVMVGAQALVIVAVIISSLASGGQVYAGTTNYTFSSAGDYSAGDAAKIEVASSTARLKSQQYATDGNTSAYYRFDETTGNVADDQSANNNDGAFSTTSPCAGGVWSAGKVTDISLDRSLYGSTTLSGNPNCLTAPDSASLSFSGANPAITVEALVRFPNAFDATADIRQSIIDKGNYRMYFSESDGKLKFELHGASTSKTWNKVGGANTTNITTTEGLNGSWRQYLPGTVQVIQEYNSALYIGTAGPTASGGTAEVWKYTSGTSWTKVAGDGVLNDQWDNINFESVHSMAVFNGLLYIGLGFSTGDGELWAYDDSPESLVRARSFTSIEEVDSIAVDGTSAIYVGLGSTAGDADVYRCTTTCTSSGNWSQIGGDALNTSWASATYERVRSMVVHGGFLFVGIGDTAAEAEVWRWNGSNAWTKMGGDGVGSTASWATADNIEYVSALASDGTNLYAGTGLTAGDADVWACTANCTSGTPSWTKIGGDGVNTSWAASTFESVRSLTVISSRLYASLGDSAGDAEVWRYDNPNWTKIGGDGVNSTWDNSFSAAGTANVKEQAFVGSFGTDLIVGTGTTPQDAEVWRCTANCSTGTPTWSWIGGRTFGDWGPAQMSQVGTMTIHNGNLYVGFGTTNKHAVLWQYDGTTWTQVGGGGIQGSNWEIYEFIRGSTTFNGKLYVGMGDTTTDADVWEWDGATWTKIGGDGLSGSWNTNYEYVSSLVNDGTYMYAGIGSGAGDAEIYKYDPAGSPNKWSKIGGDTANNWSTTREHAWQMAVYGNLLYVGLGLTGTLNATPATCRAGTDGEVWRYNGSSDNWTQIGGDGVNSSWDCSATEAREGVYSMTFLEDKLYIGLGNTADEATLADGEVWECSGCTDTGGSPTWTKVGGDNQNNGWNDTDYEWVSSLISYNGDVYAGLGNEAGDAELWRYYDHDNNTGTAKIWAKVGGDGTGTPASWSTNYETINGLTVFQGKLYAGLGNTNNTTTPSDGEVWEYGGNNVINGVTSNNSWSANTWYHVAAVYDGTSLKMYVNGVQDGATVTAGVTMADNTKTLTIGSLKGPLTSDGPYGGFSGRLDELRISNIARSPSSFIYNQYATTAQTVQPATAKSRDDVLAWSGFSATETLNGGTVTYRLSDDNATTWKYWDGDSWEVSNSTSLANAVAVINSNISTFPVTDSGILWQGILSGNGDQQVILNGVDLTYSDDTTDPVNPNATTGLNQVGGATNLSTNTWYNYASPQFSWSGATDTAGSGVRGYYVYFGTSSSADPVSAGVFQTGSTYVPSNMSSGSTYYLRIKTRDYANNVAATAYDAFTYKFDSTSPTGPSTVSVSPSGYTSVNNYQFFWPASGTGSASDLGAPTTGSGVAGYQYKLPAGTAPLNDWSTTITDTSVTIPNAATIEGPNTFELRTVDNAGNYGATVSATFYYAGSAPSHPQNLTVTPTTSVGSPSANNSFAFAWDQPEFFNGSIKQYHYSINKLPTSTNTSATTQRALVAAPYATQQGKNTFYVVAEDEAGNINYNDPASADFYTQTPAPEMPTALQIFDISNRDTQEYAISMKWTEPTKAAGFDGYQVQRSEDNITFTDAGTTKSPVFIDTNLQSKVYYYRVRSQDNAGQYSAFSSVVNLVPTGRFTSPPKLLDGPTVTAKSFSASMVWTTDRVSSSFIEYGASKEKIGKENGGDTVGQLDQVTSHAVALKGLDPETVYYYRAVWVDQDGNRGQSDILSFTTGLRPKISDVKITNITLSSADISWVSTTVASSTINFGTTRTFGQSLSDVSGSQTTKHTLRLENLSDATTYYFVITGKDVDENSLTSDEYTFTTLTRPRIENFTFETVKDSATTAIKFSWKTNVPTTTIVSYALTGQAAKTKSDSEYVTEHEVVVEALADNTPYVLQARGVDQFGNTTQSESNNFTTPDDSRPPKVSNMTIEVRSSGVGAAQKAQLVVSWETDEPSTSQVEYGPGISSDSYPSRTQEDTVMTNNHVVIVPELEPAKLYHLRAVSRDRANNAGTSADTTSITGKVQRSVIDIIIGSLQRSLGFLSVIPGFGR